MRVSRRGATTFVVGAAAGAIACALLTTGALRGGADLVGAATGLFRVPSVAADELPAFEDCEQLRQWYVDRALPQVGPYGLGGGPILMYAERSTAGALDAASPDTAIGSSGTGTSRTPIRRCHRSGCPGRVGGQTHRDEECACPSP